MNVNDLSAIQQLSSFLTGTQPVAFCIDEDKGATYQAISNTFDQKNGHKLAVHSGARSLLVRKKSVWNIKGKKSRSTKDPKKRNDTAISASGITLYLVLPELAQLHPVGFIGREDVGALLKTPLSPPRSRELS